MRLKLFILIFSFSNLIITPTLLMISVESDVDISFVFNANEEENSEKNNVSFSDYIIDHNLMTAGSIYRDTSSSTTPYLLNYEAIHQKIVCPPPDFL
ncbi:hypothetical protein [Psychroflexus sp. MES1-P1E]|uniref:hypothetical protein n=1 Tax=Psychroflexus sp. MES1-P1E TaxID=2058320 RepID=UPI000C79FBFD|nr:hypothetical protein [Psychroflexus sp. MES1-P1E]PKG42132.1 hypothetical protein CXF67_11930 [Psychroflexus sp. MES1-P1E]